MPKSAKKNTKRPGNKNYPHGPRADSNNKVGYGQDWEPVNGRFKSLNKK